MKNFSRFLLASLLLALIAISAAFYYETFAHISVVYPELRHLDSVYIDARGGPAFMWAIVDPMMSAIAEPKSKLLIEGILFNIVFYFIVSSFVLGILITFWRTSKRIYRVYNLHS